MSERHSEDESTRRIACEAWPSLLVASVAACAHFENVTVLRETGSTQDAALRLGAKPGEIITTFRQSAGRGRLGRRWIDTGEDGIAVTFVVPAAPPERLAILSAVGASRTAERLMQHAAHPPRVCVRWPNDIVVDRRKLAGILVEQDSRAARIGIGMNITQQSFPAELADRACSLAQFDAHVDRAHAISELIQAIDGAVKDADEKLRREFSERDVLTGRTATFSHDGATITGRVLDVDPAHGLRVATDTGEAFLPALTTSLLGVE